MIEVKNLTVRFAGVVPITISILVVLFVMQKQGTGFIGRIFGPVMLGWFASAPPDLLARFLREPSEEAIAVKRDKIKAEVAETGRRRHRSTLPF